MKLMQHIVIIGLITAGFASSAIAQSRTPQPSAENWKCPSFDLAISPTNEIYVSSGDVVNVTAYITNSSQGYYTSWFSYPYLSVSWVVANMPANPQQGSGWTAQFRALADGPGKVKFTVAAPLVKYSRRFKCQETQTVEKTLSVLQMTAYRPTTEGPDYNNPFQKHVIPDDQEESRGAGIRINGDDDNHDNTPDMDYLPVTGENDLIELELNVSSIPPPPDIEYILRMNSDSLNVWKTKSKTPGSEILACFYQAPMNVATLVFSSASMTVWVENPVGGTDDLELIARDKTSGTTIYADKIHFYPFSSVVALFLGEFDDPTDPPIGGISVLALAAFTNGYDAHLYDEPDIGQLNTENAAFDEIHSAIENRGVTSVALIGFSHGGGTAYRISHRMGADSVTSNKLAFSAYIDAISQPLMDITAECRRPVDSAFHVNFYQVAQMFDFPFLDGGPSTPRGVGFELNVDDPVEKVEHTTIDDAQIVKDGICAFLFGHVNK